MEQRSNDKLAALTPSHRVFCRLMSVFEPRLHLPAVKWVVASEERVSLCVQTQTHRLQWISQILFSEKLLPSLSWRHDGRLQIQDTRGRDRDDTHNTIGYYNIIIILSSIINNIIMIIIIIIINNFPCVWSLVKQSKGNKYVTNIYRLLLLYDQVY